MAPYSSTLACKIPRIEEPGRLQSMGLLRVRHDWTTSLSLFTFMHSRRKWQPTPVFLPGESQGRGQPGGLLSMGLHRVRHDCSDLAAAAAIPSWGITIKTESQHGYLWNALLSNTITLGVKGGHNWIHSSYADLFLNQDRHSFHSLFYILFIFH